MLNQIADIFQLAIDRTNLFDQYDGVVQRITVNGETFPVSCTDPSACSSGNYRKSVPDQSLKGLAYVEQRASARVGSIESWGYPITYPVRLVMWVNSGKQGIGNCSDVISQSVLNAINCLKGESELTVSFSSCPIKVKVDNFSIVSNQPNQIFQGLAYNDKQALYLWPYVFAAIDCNIIFQIPSNCISAIAPTLEVECVEY